MKKFLVALIIVAFSANCAGSHYCPSYGKASVVKKTAYKTKKPK